MCVHSKKNGKEANDRVISEPEEWNLGDFNSVTMGSNTKMFAAPRLCHEQA